MGQNPYNFVNVEYLKPSKIILMYIDNVVLLAESADDLQFLLNNLSNWCSQNKMIVNCENTFANKYYATISSCI